MVVLRRPLTGELLLTGTDADQAQFDFRESEGPTKRYEYAVLGASTRYGSLALAQLYRDRAEGSTSVPPRSILRRPPARDRQNRADNGDQ